MKILIVAPSFAPYSGVGSVRMTSLAKHLIKLNNQVTVVKNSSELWPKDSLKSTIPVGVKTIDVYADGSFQACVTAYKNSIEELIETETFDISIYSCNPYYIAPVATYMKKKV